MQHHLQRAGRWAGVFAAAALVTGVGFYARTNAQPAAAAGAYPGASTEALVKVGMKFEGAQTCANAKCHGAAEPAAKGPPFNNEFTLWSGGLDPHQKAFEQMTGAKGQDIFAKYQKLNPTGAGASLAESQRCLTCHALKVPANLAGKQYTVDEGVGCNSCHGPSEKWNPVHDKKVGGKLWGEAELAKNGGDVGKLLATTGFFYTKPVRARAEKCTTCHLAIDGQMIAAGHPQTMFDMAYYSISYPGRHWVDPDGYFQTKIWAVGQAVCLRDAGTQLAERIAGKATPEAIKGATNQLWSHFLVLSALPEAKATIVPAGSLLAGAGKDPVKLAAAGKAMSDAASKILPLLEKWQGNKASTLAALNGVVGQAALQGLGSEGIEQQKSSIYDLYFAIAGSPDKPADAEAVLTLITEQLFPASGKLDAAAMKAACAAIKAKLPK